MDWQTDNYYDFVFKQDKKSPTVALDKVLLVEIWLGGSCVYDFWAWFVEFQNQKHDNQTGMFYLHKEDYLK